MSCEWAARPRRWQVAGQWSREPSQHWPAGPARIQTVCGAQFGSFSLSLSLFLWPDSLQAALLVCQARLAGSRRAAFPGSELVGRELRGASSRQSKWRPNNGGQSGPARRRPSGRATFAHFAHTTNFWPTKTSARPSTCRPTRSFCAKCNWHLGRPVTTTDVWPLAPTCALLLHESELKLGQSFAGPQTVCQKLSRTVCNCRGSTTAKDPQRLRVHNC